MRFEKDMYHRLEWPNEPTRAELAHGANFIRLKMAETPGKPYRLVREITPTGKHEALVAVPANG